MGVPRAKPTREHGESAATYKEIAEALGVSQRSVRNWEAGALRKLRRNWKSKQVKNAARDR